MILNHKREAIRFAMGALAGVLIGLALTADYGADPRAGMDALTPIQGFFEWIARIAHAPAAAGALAALGGCFFMRVTAGQRPSALFAALSLLFGVLQVCVNSMAQADSLDFWLGGMAQAVLGSLCIMGWALLLYPCLTLLEKWLHRPVKDGPCWLDKRPFLKCFGCMAAVYMIWAVVFYPGNVDWDTYASLNSTFGLIDPSNAHPMLFNWLLGGCVWLGRAMGSDNLGFFLFVILQMLICTAVYASLTAAIYRAGLKRLSMLVLFYFMLTPIWGMFCLLGNKDTLFSCALCAFVLMSWQAMRSPAAIRFWVGYACTMAAVCLLRHGAMIMAIPVALLTVLINLRGKARVSALAVLAAGVMAVFGFNDLLLPALGIQEASAYEAFSLPYQQTARTVRDAGETLTQREKDALDGILDAARMGDIYTPWSADSVKGLAYEKVLPRREMTVKLGDFLSIWKDLGLKHPRIYIEAFLAQGGGYLALPAGRDSAEMCFSGGVNQGAGYNTGYFHFYNPPALEGIRQLMTGFAQLFRSIPLLGLLHQCGFYTWLLIGLLGCLMRSRKRKAPMIIAMVSLAVAGIMAICLISPVNAYFRYFLPVAACMPVMLAAARRELSEG